MSIYLGNKEYKDIFVGGSRIRLAYVGSSLVYQYDEIAPTLIVSSPLGTSSSNPTYTSNQMYVVSGTVSDLDSGVSEVYVNNKTATISGNTWYYAVSLSLNTSTTISVYAIDTAGNKTATIKRYVKYVTSVPKLTVTAPTGTANAPTYYESSSHVTYSVYGTVSDANAPIESVTVNGRAATINGSNWTVDMTLASNTTHMLTITATNAAGISTAENRCLVVTSSIGSATRQTMAYVFAGTNGGASSLKAANVTSQSVEGTSWRDSGHELIITYASECVPTSLTFKTPGIVNSAQAYEVTYSIYGSNSAYRGNLSAMKWTTLVSNAQWTQAGHIGNETKTLTIPSNGQVYKHIRMVTTWFYGANGYHGVHYGGLHTNGYTVVPDLELDESVIYDSGRLRDGIGMSHLELVGEVTRESNAIFMNSNPDKETFLQPYAAIGMKLSGYSEYKNINIDYKDWYQSGTTSSAKFAVCNDLQIDLGSNHRDWNSVVTKTHATSTSGTISMPWTDGKYLSAGAFSQSNQNSKLRVTKIYFSDSTIAPYNKALSLVGFGAMSSLDDVLTNADACYALAENHESVKIMKENYSNEMTIAIDVNWNEGLNMLNYQCKLKCYIIKNRQGVNGFHSTTNGLRLQSHTESNPDQCGAVSSTNPIEVNGYATVVVNGYVTSGYGEGATRFGLSSYPQSWLGYDENEATGNDMYWCSNDENEDDPDNERTSIGCGVAVSNNTKGTFTNQTFAISSTKYVFPFIAMSLPDVWGSGQSGEAYFVDLALIP